MLPHQARRLGVRQLGGGQPRQLAQAGHRGALDHRMGVLLSTKSWGVEVCQGCSCLGASWVLVGWWWAIEFYFTCSSWFCFSLCVRLLCSPQNPYETYEFSHFCPLILSPIPLWGEWVGGGVVLNHNTHFWHPLWGTDEITGSTRVHWRKFKITISVLQFLVAIFAYLLSTLFYLVHAMLTFLLSTKYESSLKAVLGFFSLLWCVALQFCFAWEMYDKSIGLEPNPVFGPWIAGIPVL